MSALGAAGGYLLHNASGYLIQQCGDDTFEPGTSCSPHCWGGGGITPKRWTVTVSGLEYPANAFPSICPECYTILGSWLGNGTFVATQVSACVWQGTQLTLNEYFSDCTFRRTLNSIGIVSIQSGGLISVSSFWYRVAYCSTLSSSSPCTCNNPPSIGFATGVTATFGKPLVAGNCATTYALTPNASYGANAACTVVPGP